MPIENANTQFVVDQQFMAKRAESLSPVTEEPATPSETVEAAPAATVQPIAEPAPQAEPTPEPVPEAEVDPFATSLPEFESAETQGAVSAAPAVAQPQAPIPEGLDDLRPAADAPTWQHESFQAIATSSDLTDDEKRTILEQKPHAWGKVKQWRQAGRSLGRFADPEVPISEFFSVLESRSKDRTAQLEVESVERIASDPAKIQRLAAEKPQLYAEFLEALLVQNDEFVNHALRKHGKAITSVSSGNTGDSSALLEELKSKDWYQALLEGTEFEDELAEVLASAMPQSQQEPEQFQPQQPVSQDAATAFAQLQQVNATVSTVTENVWSKDVADGIKAAGIRPATDAERAANPVAAQLKDILFNVARYGLDGVVEDWEEQADKFAANDPSYREARAELERLLTQGEYDRFADASRLLSPTYYAFGQRRAKIPLIQTLYKAVSSMLTGAQEAETTTATTVPEHRPNAAPSVPNTGFVADALFFGKKKGAI